MEKPASAEKNITFQWEGKAKNGLTIRGQQSAQSEAIVKALLRRQGINPTSVKRLKSLTGKGMGKKIVPADIAIFARQLATMMSAGVPMVQAFEIIGRGHEKPAMQNLVLGIKNEVESGSSLTQSLAKFPLYFDDLFVNLVGAGEQAGALETLLDKIATYKEKSEALKKKIKKALTYPIAVLVVAFIVTFILLYFVVPQFESLFVGFGADLPAFTKMVVNMSKFVQAWWWAIIGVVVGTVIGIKYINRVSPEFRRRRDFAALRMPIFGVLIRKAAIARYSRTLSTMFAAGVPLVDALTSVAGACGNILYEEGVLAIREQVSTGQQLNVCMQASGLFPNMCVQMIAIGEESGALDDMASKVADFYEAEVDNMVDSISTLIEPMIMSFLGVVVGGLVVAMYLPIFQMGQVV